jgi:hypothetical protein
MISVNIAKNVKKVMEYIHDSRISDQELYKYFMAVFYKDHVVCDGSRFYVEIADGLPQQQDVSRARRRLQGDGYYPAPYEMRKKRQELAKEAHGVLSDITESLKKDLVRTK